MNKRISEDIMNDNPEWSDKDFARARPAADVLTELFGKEGAAKVMRARGRPKLLNPKEPIKLRIDSDIISAYRAQGDGWQTRMNEALRDYAKSHGMI
ncbi:MULTISPECIES: BrnA antitoxin family protein [Candidatus Regiella]|uniref:Antitoxin n=1 Tax=Candidatus Regiella insecticola 5.15 TaxID=1005043 RepID=G2H231_9ENTR|nr:BrnA antitoxin family protein [Candidatus Regiella insecticola]EGY27951.1 hypothetical protein Rin_00021280 [Candidatus Regiella insecticola 5.15]